MRRAAPAFEILMLAPVRRFFPEPRQRLNGGWHRSRVLHPSEDLSELPPLRSVVAGQVYHDRLAGSSQNSLPKLLPAGWGRSSPYWAVFMQEHRSRTGGLRASAKSLFPRRDLPTDVLLNRIFFFQRTTEVNVPLFNPTEIRVLSTLFSKIF